MNYKKYNARFERLKRTYEQLSEAVSIQDVRSAMRKARLITLQETWLDLNPPVVVTPYR